MQIKNIKLVVTLILYFGCLYGSDTISTLMKNEVQVRFKIKEEEEEAICRFIIPDDQVVCFQNNLPDVLVLSMLEYSFKNGLMDDWYKFIVDMKKINQDRFFQLTFDEYVYKILVINNKQYPLTQDTK